MTRRWQKSRKEGEKRKLEILEQLEWKTRRPETKEVGSPKGKENTKKGNTARR